MKLSICSRVPRAYSVDDNFKIQQNPNTQLVKKVLFTPVLKEKGRIVS